MDERAQGALEYILLAGAAIMIAVLAIVIARGTLSSAAQTAAANLTDVRQHITNVT